MRETLPNKEIETDHGPEIQQIIEQPPSTDSITKREDPQNLPEPQIDIEPDIFAMISDPSNLKQIQIAVENTT